MLPAFWNVAEVPPAAPREPALPDWPAGTRDLLLQLSFSFLVTSDCAFPPSFAQFLPFLFGKKSEKYKSVINAK